MKKVILSSIFAVLFLLVGCQEQESILDSNTADNNQNYSFAKKVWYSSSWQYWDTYTVDPPYHYAYTTSVNDLEFAFRNYDFKFSWGRGGKVDVYIDGTKKTEFTWDPYPGVSSGWMGWQSFTYDGKNMQANISLTFVGVTHEITQQTEYHAESRIAQVQIEEIVAPDPPTGFSVSPSLHDNLSQTVSISWNASTDTDVTGYWIYRGKYSYYRNQLKWHDYKLVQTITSRTTTSWSDSPLWGTGSHAGIGYIYKIKAVSSTTGFESSFAGLRESYLEDYDHLMQ